VVFLFSALGRKYPKYDLALEISLFSFILIFAVEYLEERETLSASYVIDRAAMLTAGVVVAFLTSYLIFPIKGSRLIRKGLFIIIKADLGFLLSDILNLYVSSDISSEKMAEQKKVLYSNSAEIFYKTGKLKELLATTSGEFIFSFRKRFWIGTFPGERYKPIIFSVNHILYITITLFYGLQGYASNNAYCQKFAEIINPLRLAIEKLFTDLGDYLDGKKDYSEITDSIALLQLYVERMETAHQENLDSGAVFNYSFDEFQTFSHLWTCLKLLIRKTTHLVDAIHSLRTNP